MLISPDAANDPKNKEQGASYAAPKAGARADGLVPSTNHSHNVVPFILAGKHGATKLADGKLADVAPTVLALMGLEKPADMTGQSLLREKR
jgi:bisphosphoglycerate-independent phosphoglycerate mutase (AlkP superfamily)